MTLPRVPGHEVIGRIDAIGSDVEGWNEDTLTFSARMGVRSMNEVVPLTRVSEGYDLMMSGKARFRVVLEMRVG